MRESTPSRFADYDRFALKLGGGKRATITYHASGFCEFRSTDPSSERFRGRLRFMVTVWQGRRYLDTCAVITRFTADVRS